MNYLADLHCDTVLQMFRGYDISKRNNSYHIDIPRMKEGGVTFQAFAVYVDPGMPERELFNHAIALLDCLKNEFARNSTDISKVETVGEANEVMGSGKIAGMLAIENGMAIESSIEKLERFYDEGVRYMTLTHTKSHAWCSSSSDDQADVYGLTLFGKEVIKWMNSLGMIIDLSHVSPRGFYDVLEVSSKPVLVSHSNAYTLCAHDRNLTDEQLKALAEADGMVGINFCCDFLSEEYRKRTTIFREHHLDEIKLLGDMFHSVLPEEEFQKELAVHKEFIDIWHKETQSDLVTIDHVVEHIDYIVNLIGIDYVGFGSDFDGIIPAPIGLEDCSKFPSILDKLRHKGYAEPDLEKLCWKNFERLFTAVCE